MKRLQAFFALFLTTVILSAQIPEEYYQEADGKSAAELKMALKGIIGEANVLSYGKGKGHTWEGFYATDRCADNQVRDRYSDSIFYFSEEGNSVPGMDIEHSFPKSWWGGTTNQAYKDLFNLMPAEHGINVSKSNYAMGKVLVATKNNGCTKVGKGMAGNEECKLWEPADRWKGDFARSYFYMVTSYSHLTWEGEGLKMLDNESWQALQPWAYDLFMQWNREDPVDSLERARNEVVSKIQGNRNPFIDYPNLCEYLWGDSIDCAFSVDNSLHGCDDNQTTPIHNIEPDVIPFEEIIPLLLKEWKKGGPVYHLSGVRSTGSSGHGIYITNGKKILR